MALKQRFINIIFKKRVGSFSGGNNTLTLKNHRVSAKITKAGGPSMGQAHVTIYGMSLSLIRELATLGMKIQLIPRNEILVQAGDDPDNLATVFVGTITNAWGDFQSAPEVGFFVEAQTGLAEAVITVPPVSIRGSADVGTLMQSLAGQMGLSFENNGVDVKLSFPYFYGSARNQAFFVAYHAGINWIIDDRTLAIWPAGGSRGGQVPKVSKETGMVGYPAFVDQGILVTTIFNPAIGYGSKVQVESSILPPSGSWAVYSLDHDLEANMPGGKWFTTFGGYNPNFPAPVLK